MSTKIYSFWHCQKCYRWRETPQCCGGRLVHWFLNQFDAAQARAKSSAGAAHKGKK